MLRGNNKRTPDAIPRALVAQWLADKHSRREYKMMIFCERLRIAMMAGGVKNPTVLAALVGIPKQTAYRWHDGTNEKIDPQNLFKLSDVLGVSARWLMMGDVPPYGRHTQSVDHDLMTMVHNLPADKRVQVVSFVEALTLLSTSKKE